MKICSAEIRNRARSAPYLPRSTRHYARRDYLRRVLVDQIASLTLCSNCKGTAAAATPPLPFAAAPLIVFNRFICCDPAASASCSFPQLSKLHLHRHFHPASAPGSAPLPERLSSTRSGPALLLRFVDFNEGRLILRPYSRDFPVQLLPLAMHETPSDYIVGRVCLVFSEL
jgi:hypothetical protein